MLFRKYYWHTGMHLPPQTHGRAESYGAFTTTVEIYRRAREESHLVGTGVRGHDLPAVVKLLEVHRGVSDHLLLGTRKIDGPPSKGECEVRLEELDLNATGFDQPHRTTIRIPVNVGIMELLPAVKLLRIDHNQQF